MGKGETLEKVVENNKSILKKSKDCLVDCFGKTYWNSLGYLLGIKAADFLQTTYYCSKMGTRAESVDFAKSLMDNYGIIGGQLIHESLFWFAFLPLSMTANKIGKYTKINKGLSYLATKTSDKMHEIAPNYIKKKERNLDLGSVLAGVYIAAGTAVILSNYFIVSKL